MKKWTVMIILCLAQFVMVLDSTVMNVSLSTVAHDLNTTITGMQVAITCYTLTMAAFMLTGGKLGDVFGRRKAFKIGAVIYGVGSLMTGLAPNLAILLLGWSLIEGLGAVLVIPAIAALATVNYKGKARVVAFAMIGGISGAAAAAGPLIGGYVTTYLSWRYVFIAETVIMAVVLLVANKIADQKSTKKVKIDFPSVFLSAFGMGILVLGILQSKVWGWVEPRGALQINGKNITPFGISMVAYMILLGVIILWSFYNRQVKLEAKKGPALLKVSLLKIAQLRSGLSVLMSQYVITAAIFFVIPVYLQTILGFDALQTGKKIIPLSVALIIFSLLGTKWSGKRSPKRIIRIGQYALLLGSFCLLGAIDPQLKSFMFAVGMFTVGAGLGLLASQLGNINMSAVGPENSAEGGGLQGTFQNLGSSMGTALLGSIFIAALSTGFVTTINQTTLPQSVKNSVSENSKTGVAIVSQQQAYDYATSKGLTPSEATEASEAYTTAQINGLRDAMFGIVAIAALSFFLSKNIPNEVIKQT